MKSFKPQTYKGGGDRVAVVTSIDGVGVVRGGLLFLSFFDLTSGLIKLTNVPEDAIRFHSDEAIHEWHTKQSEVTPLRLDGEANIPLSILGIATMDYHAAVGQPRKREEDGKEKEV